MDLDQCVAVAALVEQLEPELQRPATVAFGDDARLGGEHRRQRRRELRRERSSRGDMEDLGTRDRIDARYPVLAEGMPNALPWWTVASISNRSRLRLIAAIAARDESTRVACAAPRENGLDRQRARAGEQVQDTRAGHIPEDREQRLSHAI